FSLGYYKELATPVRRPFLSNSVLEVIRQGHPQHRLKKNLYMSILRRPLPPAMGCATSISSSLPYLPVAMRQNDSLRDYLLRLLDFDHIGKGLLGDLLDQKSFETMRDEYFGGRITPAAEPSESWLRHIRLEVSGTVAWSLWASRAVHFVK